MRDEYYMYIKTLGTLSTLGTQGTQGTLSTFSQIFNIVFICKNIEPILNPPINEKTFPYH